MSIRRRIWMTKWATGWLPMANNMKKWSKWLSNQCPICSSIPSIETSDHLLNCSATQTLILGKRLQILAEAQELIDIGFPIKEILLAILPLDQDTSSPGEVGPATIAQQELGSKWTARGMVSISWQVQGPLRTQFTRRRHKQWLQTLVTQFWTLAWDIWNHRNEVVHRINTSHQHTILYQTVQQEHSKGIYLLPLSAHHWVTCDLTELLQRSPSYLRAWVHTVQTIRAREHRRLGGSAANRSRNILRQFLGLRQHTSG